MSVISPFVEIAVALLQDSSAGLDGQEVAGELVAADARFNIRFLESKKGHSDFDILGGLDLGEDALEQCQAAWTRYDRDRDPASYAVLLHALRSAAGAMDSFGRAGDK